MNRRRRTQMMSALAVLLVIPAAGALGGDPTFELGGELGVWHHEARLEGDRAYASGIRFIPLLEIARDLPGSSFIDLETSFDIWAMAGSGIEDHGDAELYRLKLRFATPRTETRVGLQVINFGPARILRPLRWFDSLDPRDPLQLTDGVYALRFTYVAQNNANLWLWTLYGNNELKGSEMMPTADGRPEFGGRGQIPLGPGEIALTVHARTVDPPLPLFPDCRESRFALDGRWDMLVGLWFEAMAQRLSGPGVSTTWTTAATAGADYTLGFGNGLYLLLEHMTGGVDTDEPMLDPGRDTNVTGFMLGYPVAYLDYFTAIGFYDGESDEFYQYLSWKRTWDAMILDVGLFRYPDSAGPTGRSAPLAGTGVQIMMIFNY